LIAIAAAPINRPGDEPEANDQPATYDLQGVFARVSLKAIPSTRRMSFVNVLSREKQTEVIAALCEGVGIRIALYVAHYNLCRVHEALKTTPAKAIGIADRAGALRS
jgi:hypothetical protein